MRNPENELVFCPKIQDDCIGKKCSAMKKKNYCWTNEGCMGQISKHYKQYYQCVYYKNIQIW